MKATKLQNGLYLVVEYKTLNSAKIQANNGAEAICRFIEQFYDIECIEIGA